MLTNIFALRINIETQVQIKYVQNINFLLLFKIYM